MSGFLKRPIFFLFIFFIAITSLSSIAFGQTLEIDANADAYIDNANPLDNFGIAEELKENPDIPKRPKLVIDYSVDNQPPETVITSGPADVVNINQVKITFSGTDNFSPVDALMYSFRLNGGNWSSFSIYNSLNLNKLIPGAYTFEVKARDMMGNEDSSPARRSFSYKEPVPTPYPVKNTLATNILLRTLPKKLLSGQTTKLIGELKAGGNLLSSKQVQIKANGKIIAKIRTNAGGSFSFKHKPKKNTTYQASFEGDGNYRASNSNKAKVKVKKAKKKLKKKAKAKKKKKKK